MNDKFCEKNVNYQIKNHNKGAPRCFASLHARTCHSLEKDAVATRKALVATASRNNYDDNELLRASRSRNSTSTRILALLRIAPCSYLSFARKRCGGNKKSTCCHRFP
jgi:hypothetical protein